MQARYGLINRGFFIGLLMLLCSCTQLPDTRSGTQQALATSIHEHASAHEHPYAAVFDDRRGTDGQGAGEQGAIATVNPVATHAALAVFARGGNALDAALAAAFTLGVVDGHNSGIGGGCFILVRRANGEILAIDGREIAPALAHRDLFVHQGEVQPNWSRTGALAVGIPGSVAALHQLHGLGGRLPWRDVLLPAATLAEQGIDVSATLAARLASTADDLRRFPATAAIYLDAAGNPWREGERLVQRDLAASYRALAEQGPDWFYRGDFAARTDTWMQEHGGIARRADFSGYRTRLREPLVTHFQGYSVYGFPPPSSGGLHVAQILALLAPYDLNRLSDADYYHTLAEAMKLAFADRAHWLGDPAFAEVPKALLDDDYLSGRRALMAPDRSTAVQHGVPGSEGDLFDRHTTHIAVADAEGNWVAITSTLNTSFGSKVVVPGTGVLLNNQMDDFALQPGVPNAFGLVGAEANSVAPGKRPLSSMSPTLVLRDGEPVLTLGAAGGPTIISQVVQVLLRHLIFGQPLPDAMAHARIHHQWLPDTLFVEPDMDPALRDALTALGHSLRDSGSFGGTQAIAYRDGQFVPVTEPRIIAREQSQP